MKTLVVGIISVGLIVGAAVLAVQLKTRTQNRAVPETALIEATRAGSIAVAPADSLPVQTVARSELASQPAASKMGVPENIKLDKVLFGRAVDTLLSENATHEQKQAAWKQLRDAGRLDAAIVEMERMFAEQPNRAQYAALLGHAYLQKCGTLHDVREQGILALQADKLFDTALNLDPGNWEARFTKAVALSYWPPNMNKGDEVIQQFQTLIDQQESQPSQPHFAQTYLWLGSQYQKTGQADEARAVWQRGLSLFPQDVGLRNKLAGAE
jgi:tetratricopeptide (TPR) repeat protein